MPLRIRRGTNAERQLITPLEGELIYVTDHEIRNVSAVWVGDGITPGGKPADSVAGTLSLNSLTDVDTTTVSPQIGDVLKWNGSVFAPQPDIDTQGLGVIEGSNYRINVIADDSTVLVDSSTNALSGNIFTDEISYTDVLNVNNTIPGLVGQINLNHTGGTQKLVFKRTDTGTTSDQIIGLVTFDQEDDLGTVTYSTMGFWHSGIYIGHSSNGTFDTTNYLGFRDGRLAIGAFSPQSGFALDVNGNSVFRGSGSFSGDLTAAAFKGSVVSDDSTVLVDSVNGTIPGYISISQLQSIAATSATYEEFQLAIAAL